MTKVTRSQLYAMVWSKPMTRLAKEFDISDVGLAKACRKNDIPLPPRGYWAKLEAGQEMKATPLPKPENDPQIEFGERAPASKAFYAEKREREIEEKHLIDTLPPIPVPLTLENPHRLTKATKKYFEEVAAKLAKADKRKRYPRWNEHYEPPPLGQHGRYTCPADRGFDVTLSLEHLDRALRFLDTLVKALETQGFKVSNNVEGPNSYRRYVEATRDNEGVRFFLNEGYKRRMLSAEEFKAAREQWAWAKEYEMAPSGKLSFTVNGREGWTERKWTDDAKQIEERLPAILAEFINLVPRQKQLRVERARQEEECRIRQWRAQQEEWTRSAQRRQFQDAMAEAELLDKLIKMEAYLRHLEEKYAEVHGKPPEGNDADWFYLMRQLAQSQDPVSSRLSKLQHISELDPSELDWVPKDIDQDDTTLD